MATSKFPGGTQVTTFQPPCPGTDLLNAPRSVLKSLGLWPALAHPVIRRRWSRLLGTGTHYIEPAFEWNKGGRHRASLPTRAAGFNSKTWSGALVYAPAGQIFKSITAQWIVPQTRPSPTGEPTRSCFWIGIDGDAKPGGSRDVCQMGIECDTGNTGGSPFYPFWEWFPDGETPISNFSLSPGDTVCCQLTIVPDDGTNPLHASILMKNLTTGGATKPSQLIPAPSSAGFMGNCAEWIAERPSVDNIPSLLTNYGEVTFKGCSTSTGTQSIQPGPQNTLNMVDNVLLSAATSPNPGTVDCKYMAA